MKIATFIKSLSDFTGEAALYKVNPPMPYGYDWETEESENNTEYIVVSATVTMFSGPETYIFPANESGDIIDWSELDGSYRGGLSHTKALNGAGYEIKTAEAS